MSLSAIIAVFIGSGLGGACRYVISKWLQSLVPASVFPWGTFTVNVLGCLLIGLFYGWFDRMDYASPEFRLLLTVGFCGGFTTFSTFINENYLLFSGNTIQVLTAMAYMLVSIVVGFVMLYIGYSITH